MLTEDLKIRKVMLEETTPQRIHAKPRQGRLPLGGGPAREPMTGQHARILADQDGHGARGVEVCKQHTWNQCRKCMAWKQRTLYTRRWFDGQARWQQSH